ncbi:MAG: hypothetical protein PHW63_10635 [Alphaproteobacteria bacterium]|nr:hypothetical protein [Alphaproteobacteria bacterium]
MGKTLKFNTAIRRTPPAGDITFFKAGDTLPEWAESFVGSHLFEDAQGSTNGPKEVERKLPAGQVVEPPVEKELTVPSRKAGAATWKKFAKEAGYTVPPRATRNEIIEKVLEHNPGLEISED